MEALREIVRTVWGYSDFRPLQAEAMSAVMSGRDSVVVLPTGGGKSLCFQAPALCLDGLALVVSPLISLMKDQVDALADYGVAAACVNSSLSPDERRRVADEIRAGRLKLLYLSPERLMTQQTLSFLQKTPLSFIAVDEAHCISDWGHDFRPEYRSLRMLKATFPGVAIHAYTATATARVRDDVARELQLDQPEILVGSFDRPNLVYRVGQRAGRMDQICEVIDRHPHDSGIVYCIRRVDVDEVAAALTASGRQALPYHAGLSDEDRRSHQDAFINDRVKIIVATVAFGMGIDKSDVRYVIHAAAPKSLESYQQESGRAGRDGLEAECCLFYSGADFQTWRILQQKLNGEAAKAATTLLAGIADYCAATNCRHRSLVGYFGQSLEAENCGACDVCLDELEFVTDALIVAQKILSCVLRLEQNFGVAYTTRVLVGSSDQRILDAGHDRLSTYGILAEHPSASVRAWTEQLVGQQLLEKSGEYAVLRVTAAGRQVLRGELTPRLLKSKQRSSGAAAAGDAWDGVDRELFEELRRLRLRIAGERGLPPFVVFGDATLRDLARKRPSTPARLLDVHGVGERKSEQYGEEFLRLIRDYCQRASLTLDVDAGPLLHERRAPASGVVSGAKLQAFELFAQGNSSDDVSKVIGRARSTTAGYLLEYIAAQQINDPTPWLDADTFQQICAAAANVGAERLKPIFEALAGAVDYEQIRIAMACLQNHVDK